MTTGTLTATATKITSVSVIGGAGNDLLDASKMTMGVTLNGGNGTDTLVGGAGDDQFILSPGNDTYQAGTGHPRLVYNAHAGDQIIVYGQGILNGSVQTSADGNTRDVVGTYLPFGTLIGVPSIEVDGTGPTGSVRTATADDLPGTKVWSDAGSYSTQETVLRTFHKLIQGYGYITEDDPIAWSQRDIETRIVVDPTGWVEIINQQSNSLTLHVHGDLGGNKYEQAQEQEISATVYGYAWMPNWVYYWNYVSGYGLWTGNAPIIG